MKGLDLSHAVAVAERFSLGSAAQMTGPVARGQLGQVWRLETDAGAFAVKEWFAEQDVEELTGGVALQERLGMAGVPTPAVIRTRQGDLTTDVSGVQVRVHGWLDVAAPSRELPPAEVGGLIAAMHLASEATTDPVSPWYSEGIGEARWRELLDRARAEGAPFAEALGARLDELVAVESLVEPPGPVLECHRDLWSDNVLRLHSGGLCVIDFENSGPADPGHELAMALFEFGLDSPGRARQLHDAYVAAGGPGRVAGRADFSMLVAAMAHLGEHACTRWFESGDPVVRANSEALMEELLDDAVTLPRIDRILVAL